MTGLKNFLCLLKDLSGFHCHFKGQMESLCRLKGLRDFLWDLKRFLKVLLRYKLGEMCLMKGLWCWLLDV